MTTRERHLVIGVGAALGVGLVGFVAYSFVLSPLLEKNKQIKQREIEVAQLQNDIDDIVILKRRFESARQQSLPSDPVTGVSLSRTQYSNLLEKLLRHAEYANGSYKIQVLDPDTKSAPMIAPKRPAYTKLTYELTLKGELYHLVDFMQSFYQQPLLHNIKKLNIIRPSDQRAQGLRQLDTTMTIEALVLDNAMARGTLLPIVREVALVSSPAAFAGLNVKTVTEGRGSPLVPTGVLADMPREYLAVDGKNVFFGPAPTRPVRKERALVEDDHSPFVTLVSVVGDNDGKIVAVFRDKLDNNNYTITQSPKGVIAVKGEYEIPSEQPGRIPGKVMLAPGYSAVKPRDVLHFGSKVGLNRREWRVRRVFLDSVIVEKLDLTDVDPDTGEETKPKPHPLAMLSGGLGAYVAVPEGKVYRVGMGQSLEVDAKGIGGGFGGPAGGFAAPGSSSRVATPPTKYLLLREAWRDIFAPPVEQTFATSEESRGR